MYLATNARPNIAFAVNQAARFCNEPKRVHEKAVNRIGRYLKNTKDQRMVVNPERDLRLDLFTDADFAGLYIVKNVT